MKRCRNIAEWLVGPVYRLKQFICVKGGKTDGKVENHLTVDGKRRGVFRRKSWAHSAMPSKSRRSKFLRVEQPDLTRLSLVTDAKSEIESLRDELSEWHDNLPENLQSGSKADELDTAISELEDVISDLESAEGASVDFPAMF